jgi:hypothetical protein
VKTDHSASDELRKFQPALTPMHVHELRRDKYPGVPRRPLPKFAASNSEGRKLSSSTSIMACSHLDYDLHALATRAGFVYARYSDDMVMSTCQNFDRAQSVPMIREITRLVTAHRFRLHRKETRVIPPGARHIVLGLTPEFRRRVEVHIRGVRKFRLAQHSDHRGVRSLLSFINHVEGLLAFAQSVEPTWADSQRAEWRTVLGALSLRM